MADDTSSVPPTHDRKGKFAPGNNMGADIRRKRQRGMARLIAQETDNGLDLVRGALEIARDATHRDRLKAIDWLAIRLCGKPPETVEVTGKGGAPLNPLHGFTPEQLLALAKDAPKGEP